MRPDQPIQLSRRAAIAGALSSAFGAIPFGSAQADSKTAPSTPLTISEQLLHSTVQIISEIGPGITSSGTGFFFAFFHTGTQEYPAIVTNKHVIAGASVGHLRLTLRKTDGSPDLNNITNVTISDFANKWIFHPNPNVDLAIMPFGQIANNLTRENKPPFFITFPPDLVPTPAQLGDLTALEDVILVGYPDAISDKTHNLPVFRRGITASPVYVDFDNMSEFLIDAAVFPGSSGSPVILYNQGSFASRNGGITVGSRVLLLGVVHAVYNNIIDGRIIMTPAPTRIDPSIKSLAPNNLGICVKASRVLEFEPILVENGVNPPNGYKMRAAIIQ